MLVIAIAVAIGFAISSLAGIALNYLDTRHIFKIHPTVPARFYGMVFGGGSFGSFLFWLVIGASSAPLL